MVLTLFLNTGLDVPSLYSACDCSAELGVENSEKTKTKTCQKLAGKRDLDDLKTVGSV